MFIARGIYKHASLHLYQDKQTAIWCQGKGGNFISLIPFAFLWQMLLDFLGGVPVSSSTRSNPRGTAWGQTVVLSTRSGLGSAACPACTHIHSAEQAQPGFRLSEWSQVRYQSQNPLLQRYLWKRHLTFGHSSCEVLLWSSAPTAAGQTRATRGHFPPCCLRRGGGTGWTP